MSMNIQPLKSYKVPKYPEKKIVNYNKDILKTVPERWRKNIGVCIAFSSLLCITLTACGEKNGMNSKYNSSSNSTEGKDIVKCDVAPLFEHGEGIGGYGCVSVAPPVFLSEEEAYQIITDEAKRNGLKFQNNGEKLKNVQLPVTYTFPESVKIDPNDPEKSVLEYKYEKDKAGDLELDGYDKNKKVSFEFVSVSDFKQWIGDSKVWASVETYNVLEAARTLRDGIQDRTDEKFVGIFYDPIAHLPIDEATKGDSITKREKMSEELLRKQVIEFISWLKAEGVI